MTEEDSCECDDCNGECHHNNDDPMAQFDNETRAAIQEIQVLEQNFEQLMQQKNLFNMEINETSLALTEVEKSDGELFKVVGGQVMIKSSKEKLTTELKHKKELLSARMKNIESQEKDFSERIETLRQNILNKISQNK